MGTQDEGGKRDVGERNDTARNVFGPRPVGNLVPALTRPAFRRRSPATTQILTDWATIVGPALAAVTIPRRLTGTSLTLACAGPIAMELQHMSSELAARINGHLGRVVVERFRFVQEALPVPAGRQYPVRTWRRPTRSPASAQARSTMRWHGWDRPCGTGPARNDASTRTHCGGSATVATMLRSVGAPAIAPSLP